MNKISFLNEKEQAADNLLRHALEQNLSGLIGAPTRYGKCLAPDTPVMMFDGSVRPAKSVVESACIRHHSIRDLAHFSELTSTEKNAATPEQQNAERPDDGPTPEAVTQQS